MLLYSEIWPASNRCSYNRRVRYVELSRQTDYLYGVLARII